MATPNFVLDNKIIWLELPKRGTPPEWQPGVNYNIGDTVIPRSSFAIPTGKEDSMFQCVGFAGQTAAAAPSWPSSTSQVILHGDLELTSRDPTLNPAEPTEEEYYYITRTITVASS